jgi:hypothetical protein
MKTKEITINRDYAKSLENAILDFQWDKETDTWGQTPLSINTRPVVYINDNDEKFLSAEIKLAGKVIGTINLTMSDALLLSSNITNAVRNKI